MEEAVVLVAGVPLDGRRRGVRALLPSLDGGLGGLLQITPLASSNARLPRAFLLAARELRHLLRRPAVRHTQSKAGDESSSLGGEAGLLPRGPGGGTAVDDAVEDLGEVLEVAELGDGARVEGVRIKLIG